MSLPCLAIAVTTVARRALGPPLASACGTVWGQHPNRLSVLCFFLCQRRETYASNISTKERAALQERPPHDHQEYLYGKDDPWPEN